MLTPSYVATLLVKLARVNKDSYVWDFATGSAGLLVAAMNEMLNDAKNTINSPEELSKKEVVIKAEQLLGLELLSSVYMLAILNMILMGDGSSNILNKDSLIDFDGKPTRWGIWHPDSLNHSPNWMYERGLNSLQILSFLKTAYHFTGDSKFEKHYQYLVKQHGYAKNAVQAKVFGPFETSHSDDILNFFPYYNLLRYSQGDPHRELYQKSLLRSWQAVRNDHMPVWNVLSSVMLNKDCDLQIALQEIQQYPIDLVNWTMENSHRWDLPKDQLVSRSGKLQSTKPIPTPESNISRWNTNPKHFDAGDDGKTEESGSYFLAAYWIGRYHGFWK